MRCSEAPRTESEAFKAMLDRAGVQYTTGFPFVDPPRQAINFSVGAGLAGSPSGFVTAHFKEDGTLDYFMFCD